MAQKISLGPDVTDADKLELIRKVLGFGVSERRKTGSGAEINVTRDAHFNLLGVIEDAGNSNGFDTVSLRTVVRVADQIGRVAAVLDGFDPELKEAQETEEKEE